MAMTLAMLATFLTNSFRIHPMASLSFAAFFLRALVSASFHMAFCYMITSPKGGL